MIQCRFGPAVNATVAHVAHGNLLGNPVQGVFLVSRLHPLVPDGRGGWGLLVACRLHAPGETHSKPEVLLERCDAQIEEEFSGEVVTEIRLTSDT